MLKKKTLTAMFSLALAGTMVLPAFAAEAIPARQGAADLKPLIAEAPTLDLPLAADEHLLTRAELVSVLHEQEGKPSVNFAMRYTDVDQEAEYAEAVRWATSQGIACGYGDGTFGPDDMVTREQMAVILYRYAQSKDQGFTGAWAVPLPYADAGEVSSFAYEAVCWVTMKDVMGETGDNQFAPDSGVTHSEANPMLQQYFSAVEQTEIANPFLECKTMEEAAQVAGFSMELPQGAEPVAIRAVEDDMIEVLCQMEAGTVTLRKAVGDQDISGDYNHYAQTDVREWNGRTVTLKGTDGMFMTATWLDGGYTYAVRAEGGLDRDGMYAILSQMQ